MSGLHALQAALLRVLFQRMPADSDLALLGDPNVLVYRELARARFIGLLQHALPRSLAALPGGSDAIDGFLHESPPTTRFFRDVPLAFADRVLRGEPAGPPYLFDLVRLERARWHAMIAEEPDDEVLPFDLSLRPVLSATATVLSPRFSVHLEGEPAPTEDLVVVFRRPDHGVETRWMRGLAARLTRAWAEGDETAIDAARAVAGACPPAELVETLSDLGATLLDRGAIRGSRR